MATTAKKIAEPEVPAGYRWIQAPAARRDVQPLIIGVNGVNTAIPQDGRMHLVKEEVAYEYERSIQAQMRFYDLQAELAGKSKIV